MSQLTYARQIVGSALPRQADRARVHTAFDESFPTNEALFTINGRFLTQPVTGVQRYALEVTRALDVHLSERKMIARLVTPARPRSLPDLKAITIAPLRPSVGHFWEQTTLPLHVGGALLNLCNTAPMAGTRNVICIHDANVFVARDSYSSLFRAFYKILQPWIVRRAVAVTTVSKSAAVQIGKHLGLDSRHIVVLPNGHEHVRRWQPDRSKYLNTVQRPFVLMIGSLASHKNIGRIVGLAEALDRIGLDIKIVGQGASIFTEAARAAQPNVHWLGSVSDDDLAYLLQNALCLAFPSISEGFGIPALEAMALGCPVVASNSSSLPEVCGDAALYADPGDDRQWFEKLRMMATSSDLRATLRENGFDRAQRFRWSETAQTYLDLLAAA